MPLDELIEAVERVDARAIPCVVQASIRRYRELYPNWRILFLSAEVGAGDTSSMRLLELIDQADEIFAQKLLGKMNEK